MVDVNAAERLPMNVDDAQGIDVIVVVNAEPPPVQTTEVNVASCSGEIPPPPTKKAGNGSQDANEPAEQDLSEEDDDYQDTFVQRYVPGVYVDVKLKDVYRDDSGKMQRVPMVIDFFEECLKTYKDERKFIYEDSYLRTSRGVLQASVSQNGNGNPCNGQAVTGKQGDAYHLKSAYRSPAVNAVAPPDRNGVGENGTHEVSLDDVKWMKNRPNDPLLKCIQSITDRLNIQGIVGDPTSYLKEGGDDMHYDIDDPFIDDAELYSELRMSRNDILQKGQIEKDFSVWSEEEEEEGGGLIIQPESFVAEYASGCDLEEVVEVETEEVIDLFFNPAGWKRFHDRVPKQFRPIFKNFEETFKGFSGYMSTDDIIEAVKDMLDKIFARLTKMPEPRQKKASTIKDDGETVDETDEQRRIMERHGLDCVGVGKIIGVNGRIMRWIVRTITEMTNALSCYQLNEMWIKLVLSHNAETINQMEAAIVSKLKPKLVQLKEKRTAKYFNKMDDHLKNLSKRIGQLRKVVREYETAVEMESEQNLSRMPPNDSVSSNRCGSKGGDVKGESLKPSDDTTTTRVEDMSSQERPNDDKESVVTDDTKVNGKGASITPLRCSQSSNDNMGPTSSVGGNSLHGRGPGLTLDDLKCSLSEDDCRTLISEVDDNSRQYTQDDQQSPVGAQPHSDGGITSFSGILRQSKLWKRIKDVITMYKMASTDLLTLVQMINVALATSISIGGTDFSPLVKDAINLPYVFDKAYIRIADMFSGLVEEICLVKIAIPPDVSRVAIMFLHEASAVVELFEYENEDPLVFCDNSKVAAPEGKVKIIGNKRTRKLPTSVLANVDDAVDNDKARQAKKKISPDIRQVQTNNSNDLGNSEDVSLPKEGKTTSKGDKIHGKQKGKTPTTQKEKKRNISKELESSGTVKAAISKNQNPNKSQKVTKMHREKEA